MSNSNVKDIRKQVRNVVQEVLPGVMTQEMYVKLLTSMNERMDALEAQVKAKMQEIEERSKDVQSYLIRSSK